MASNAPKSYSIVDKFVDIEFKGPHILITGISTRLALKSLFLNLQSFCSAPVISILDKTFVTHVVVVGIELL